MRQPRPWGWLEVALWFMAALCSTAAATQVFEARAGRTNVQVLTAPQALSDGSLIDAVIGRLEILQIGLDVPIVDNYNAQQLLRGVGHVPGSALPGGFGNLVLAGHRDTFFRPLRNVRPGMEINVVTLSGHYRYRIDTTEIVTPDHVEILDIGERPEMTLITCFPFDYVGPAPKRFIVHAHLLLIDAA